VVLPEPDDAPPHSGFLAGDAAHQRKERLGVATAFRVLNSREKLTDRLVHPSTIGLRRGECHDAGLELVMRAHNH